MTIAAQARSIGVAPSTLAYRLAQGFTGRRLLAPRPEQRRADCSARVRELLDVVALAYSVTVEDLLGNGRRYRDARSVLCYALHLDGHSWRAIAFQLGRDGTTALRIGKRAEADEALRWRAVETLAAVERRAAA